jgi:hypothetical protein
MEENKGGAHRVSLLGGMMNDGVECIWFIGRGCDETQKMECDEEFIITYHNEYKSLRL